MGNSNKKDEGGYMRSLHTLEEQIYGPESTLDNKAKVFLCVRHNTLRWDIEATEISYDFLIKKTGVIKREVIKATKKLEDEKLLSVLRRKMGKRFLPNVIGLNKEFFGELLEKKHAPNFTVIRGGIHKEKLSTKTIVDEHGWCALGHIDYVSKETQGVVRFRTHQNPTESAPIAGFAEPKELRERKNLKNVEGRGELDAHEERKKHYIQRGSGALSTLIEEARRKGETE